jgi:hypothetical protein
MFESRTLRGAAFALTCLLVGASACDNAGSTSAPSLTANSTQAGSGAATLADSTPSDLSADTGAVTTTSTRVDRAPFEETRQCANSGAAKEGVCKDMVSGIYGVKIELDVWWLDELNTSSPLFDPGRGTITILTQSALSEFCQDGSGGESEVRGCDLRLPPLYADASGSVVQLALPTTIWEQREMPSFTSAARATGFGALDEVLVDPVLANFGIALASDDAPWPSYRDTPFFTCSNAATGADCFPDHDGDGHPGITARLQLSGAPPEPSYARRGGWHYAPALTDSSPEFFGSGATSLYLGLRAQLSGSHPIGAGCQGGSSSAEAAALELRVLDCAMKDGTRCTAAASTFVDENVPVFHVLQPGETPPANWQHRRADANARLDRSASVGPRNRVVRLGALDAASSCSDVRAAFAMATE